MHLEPSAFFVDSDIGVARTLPPQAFTDSDFLELELATVFSRNWLFVPQRTSDELRADARSVSELLSLRGAHTPLSLMDRPLFLQRDWQDRLHCFPNVCTHAWYPLVQGPGRERSIVCRQHGRRFDCDGRYLGQPGFEGLPAADDDSLSDLPLAGCGPFLFTAFQQPALPFAEMWAEIAASACRLPFASFERRPQSSEVRELEGNWKQHAWNYMDVFHLTYIHRAPGGLVDALDMDSYRTELYSGAALQWAYAANPEHGFDPALLPDRFAHQSKRVFALWWFVFPNLALSFYPWGLSVNVYMPLAGQPQRTRFLWYHYVLDDAKYARRDELWLNRQVDAEDVDALRQVSRGARSGFATRGRFAPEKEIGPHWFHRLVYTTVFEPNPARE